MSFHISFYNIQELYDDNLSEDKEKKLNYNYESKEYLDRIYLKLKGAINKNSKLRITLEELYTFADEATRESGLSRNSIAFETAFEILIARLLDDKILKPIKTTKPNHRGIYPRYSKVKIAEDYDQIRINIINTIKKPMIIDYYLTHPKEFLQDRIYIEKISEFFERKEKPTWITVNERSYDLFDDEKFLIGSDKTRSRGEAILSKLGLTYDDLYCKITLEPFFCFLKKDFAQKKRRKVFVIENKDTFWSFKYVAYDNKADLDIDMLIYGEGKKILSSFQFVREYELDSDDEFYYFGDLDPEGINIFIELTESYSDYNIKPYILGYKQLLLITKDKEIKPVPKDQRYVEGFVDNFIQKFDKESAGDIKLLLETGGYIPQEAFSREKMELVFSCK